MHRKNEFAEVSKNSARQKSKNNFVGKFKIITQKSQVESPQLRVWTFSSLHEIKIWRHCRSYKTYGSLYIQQ